jgi:hypothetical protein
VTNFIVDFKTQVSPVIMYEFNYEGPRLSDLIYLLRHFSKEYRIAKHINETIHLNVDYSNLDRDIENIFSIEVKVKASSINRLNWHKELKHLQDSSGYRDVRIDFSYKRNKDNFGRYEKNIKGLDFARGILGWVKSEPENLDYVEDLKMEYQVSGSDEIIGLDFLKNRTTSVLKIPLTDKMMYTQKDFRHFTGQELNKYLASGETTKE